MHHKAIHRARSTAAGVWLAALSQLGCAVSSDTSSDGDEGGGNTGGTTSDIGGAGTSTGAADAIAGEAGSDTGGTDGSGGAPGGLPLAVDDFFVPSGFMGDGAEEGNVVMLPNTSDADATCSDDRPSTDTLGQCHTVTYTPAAEGWAGVYWQSPEGNWGDQPGFAIPPGAQSVSFYAKGERGGEVVKFVAGGIEDEEMAHQDAFRVEETVTLSDAWQPYSLDLSSMSYDEVIGAFAWVVSVEENDETDSSFTFWVDDIRWE